jgi:argininosuccinate lyase
MCEERGQGPADVTPALLDEAALAYHDVPVGLDEKEIRAALDPSRFIAARALRGGPAPSESLRQAGLFQDALAADEEVVTGVDLRLANAARNLEQAVDAVIARGA